MRNDETFNILFILTVTRDSIQYNFGSCMYSLENETSVQVFLSKSRGPINGTDPKPYMCSCKLWLIKYYPRSTYIIATESRDFGIDGIVLPVYQLEDLVKNLLLFIHWVVYSDSACVQVEKEQDPVESGICVRWDKYQNVHVICMGMKFVRTTIKTHSVLYGNSMNVL